ncbi:MAG: NADH:flavin oxidoreductase [Planctomycetota bacterium]|jgi:2,4-dienoyl-CoA reductase-like NADH-dependent reductase (Old Yellow Enzyme family)
MTFDASGSLLFSPTEIRGLRLENRIVLPAMVTRLSGADGFVNGDIRDRYLRHARGEPGLMVLEAMGVNDSRSGPLLRASDARFVPGLRELVTEVHASSPTRVAAQIIHFLKLSRSGWRQTIRDLDRAEILQVVEDYGEAAARIRDASFDAVELHMAHAYTLSSFLSRRNDRSDEFGGRSIESRLRLPSLVLQRVRERVGPDFPVGIRFDGEEAIKDGYSVADAALFAVRFARLGADWLSISAGGKFEDAVHRPGEPLYPYTGYSGDRCMPSAAYPDGLNVYLGEGVKRALNERGLEVPVVATGKIRTPELAESILRDGRADLIGMARQLLADPDWPRKVREGRADTVVCCVYNNVCKALDERFHRVRCTLWRKHDLQAPLAPDHGDAPVWPEDAALEAREADGRVRLEWTPAVSDAGDGSVYGYMILRSEADGPWIHIDSARGVAHRFEDAAALGGTQYRYRIVAYDLAGNRSQPLGPVTIRLAALHA